MSCRCLVSAWVVVAFATLCHAQPQQAIMPEKHFNLFEKYCLDCHDADTEKGGVNLEDLAFDIDTIQSAELWQKVLNVTNSGEMPPEDKDQLTDQEKTEFLSDLSNQLVIAREALSDSGGVITMRRLNRREYENTIEHLLGVKIDAGDLPDDANSGGFDTAGAALFFSSDQFEQYIKIARRSLDQAIYFGDQPKVKKSRTQPETFANKRYANQAEKLKEAFERGVAWKKSGDKSPRDFGFIDAARVDFETGQYNLNYPSYDYVLNHPLSKDGVLLYNFFRDFAGPSINVPGKANSGTYTIRAKIAVIDEKAPEHRRYIEYGATTKGARVAEINIQGCRKITGTLENPEVIEVVYQPTEGAERNFKIRERNINNGEAAKRFYQDSWRKTKNGPPPVLWVDWIEWEGPFFEQWPPKSHRDIFIAKEKGQSVEEYYRSVLTNFATKAFRTKEPSQKYIDRLMRLYRAKVAEGEKPGEAIKEPLSIILASPGFLYLNEPTHGSKRHELSDRELAVRLSYFLWSAPPDEELFKFAESGKLKEKWGIRKQTERMLKDPRAKEFIAGFAHQWLHMERLDFFQFNYLKYPRFDSSVKEAARQEVYEMIRFAILEGRHIGELLKSDHVMVNNLLAGYYGIEGVEGENFRRVPVPEGLPRGGLLGTAAVMAMGSDGERSSPVERGAWILRCLLNDPPPPAPANVPQLSRLAGKPLTAREMAKAHQEEPQCSQCHRKIDPLGFGLENFDAVGLWRDVEIFQLPKAEANRAKRQKKPTRIPLEIDPSGIMPDGKPFKDFFELRDRISEREDDFARGFTENLIEYALGRPFGFTDQNLAEQVMNRAKNRDYAMNEFILGVVQSKRFKLK